MIFNLNIATYLLFIPITVLNYKFDELIKTLRVAIRWNNNQRIHQVLQTYNQLISCVKKLSAFYNMIIGMIYFLLPYIIAIDFELINTRRKDFVFKLSKIAFIALFLLLNIGIFMIMKCKVISNGGWDRLFASTTGAGVPNGVRELLRSHQRPCLLTSSCVSG